ncbi:response regulator [Halovivax limisalsi]|uniref:response regulator n=1 Tax=Halovivax limisalsi TaxID=1453760 RepID=UPI001FFD1669|nr:response regulator [Halovivax limisalsi]
MSDLPLSVLIVEDNEGDVRLIENGLDESDVPIEPTVVTDGEAALDRLLDPPADAKPDLLLLDLNIPKRTGRDVLAALQAASASCPMPTLVLSGSRSDEHIRETLALGADGYAVKPVDPQEFISLIGSVVRSVADSGTVPPGEHAEIESPT